ncbi:MAG: putative dehydrogenase, partial [Kiritimatiellia bacterium]
RWCFIEKPAAHTADDARALMGPRVLVGHSERHNPALRRGIPEWWRHAVITRTAPSSGRCRDVDVALDLMLHDLDLLLACRGEPRVLDVRGTWGEDDVLDDVHALLRWPDGSDAALHASRLGAQRERTWRLRGGGRTVCLDLDVPLLAGQADALTAQWQAFVDAVYGRSALPMASADAAAAVELAARISARAHEGAGRA